MKNYIKANKKGLILSIVGLLFLSGFMFLPLKNKDLKDNVVDYEVTQTNTMKVITDEEKLELFIQEYSEELDFFAKTFGIETDVLKTNLKDNYQELNILNLEESFPKFLINYLLELEKTEKDLFDNTKTACDKDKDYMVNLINYFSNIYGNVDFTIAASIAQIESGYRSQSMLNKNNIFGGMSGGRLISYKNIEYGILRYIKLLSEGYFAKGLTTVENIGKVYNPVINEFGVKVANPNWVKHVNSAMDNFQGISAITNISEILILQETLETVD